MSEAVVTSTATHTTDTPQLLLVHHLKELRLPTILREYDKVPGQCAVEQVDYARYLLRMTELELLDRERRATKRRIRQAKFPVVKTMDTFDFLAYSARPNTLAGKSTEAFEESACARSRLRRPEWTRIYNLSIYPNHNIYRGTD